MNEELVALEVSTDLAKRVFAAFSVEEMHIP
jgi:hypothetical protein